MVRRRRDDPGRAQRRRHRRTLVGGLVVIVVPGGLWAGLSTEPPRGGGSNAFGGNGVIVNDGVGFAAAIEAPVPIGGVAFDTAVDVQGIDDVLSGIDGSLVGGSQQQWQFALGPDDNIEVSVQVQGNQTSIQVLGPEGVAFDETFSDSGEGLTNLASPGNYLLTIAADGGDSSYTVEVRHR